MDFRFLEEWRDKSDLIEGRHYFYVMQEFQNGEDGPPIKVGFSSNPFARQAALATGNWRGLELVHLFECASRDDARNLEQHVLRAFQDDSLGGEWIDRHADDIYNFLVG